MSRHLPVEYAYAGYDVGTSDHEYLTGQSAMNEFQVLDSLVEQRIAELEQDKAELVAALEQIALIAISKHVLTINIIAERCIAKVKGKA